MKEAKAWKELIQQEMTRNGESFSDVVYSTLSPAELDREMEFKTFSWVNPEEAPDFKVWTEKYVYFSDRLLNGYASVVLFIKRNPPT